MRRLFSSLALTAVILLGTSMASAQRRGGFQPPPPAKGVNVGEYPSETRRTYTTVDGLPDDDVAAVTVNAKGEVFAGTAKGVVKLDGDKWQRVSDYGGPMRAVASDGAAVFGATQSAVYKADEGEPTLVARLPEEASRPDSKIFLAAAGGQVFLAAPGGLYELKDNSFVPAGSLNSLLGDSPEVRQVAIAGDGRIAAAAAAGLFLSDKENGWQAVLPHDGTRSWAPRDVRGVAFDEGGRLWFASPQGAGVLEGEKWTLYEGEDGLPYNDFTTIAAGPGRVVYFGTKEGLIRFNGKVWEYRRAPRWLPANDVRSIAVGDDGRAWIATDKGVGLLAHETMTFAQKAKFFEDEIDKYHRRTPYGYVLAVRLKNPADKSEWTQDDSDNDGLWTAMYGAGECYAYAATKDPKAKGRAKAAFEALAFLGEVTQGGTPPALPGTVARTILPTSGENPNAKNYTPEKDRERQQRDLLWKVMETRWPTSADGKWYWKSDVSSDELDGHFYLYAVYYDLVAETDEEKQRCREVVTRICDHLIEHDYDIIDHDGKPTRWARYSPKDFNQTLHWHGGRGLNSLSILSYLKVAEHVSGDSKYRDAYLDLVNNHSYHMNVMVPKVQTGPGTGNQSDDEMALMCFYNLIRYEDDPERKRYYKFALRNYWQLEEPELNPFFNFVFASATQTKDEEGPSAGGNFTRFMSWVPQSAIDQGVDTLKRYPMDRLEWEFKNSHRIDLVKFAGGWTSRRGGGGRGHRRDGTVLPIDERVIDHWNQDPWQLNGGGDGRSLTDGAAYLLPYYMGLYHGYIIE